MSVKAKKALIAMSGGVDSSVAVFLSLQSGYDCIGATMRLLANESGGAEDAAGVAQRLGIPFFVFDFTEEFRTLIMDSFVFSYEQGLTPNPCIVCNRLVKFDLLLRRAAELGCEQIVTGHYAKIRKDPTSDRYVLYRAEDRAKDQSYFLYSLSQEQLKHIFFPLGELTKAQVRDIAQQQGFLNAKKKDSQDICFVPDGDYRAFMERHTGKPLCPGNFLDLDGNIIGRHIGAAGYTLGQRKGLGLAMGEPVYVCRKNMEDNTVTVGPEERLYHHALLADEWNWLPFENLTQPLRVQAKTRSRQTEQNATVYPMEDGFAKVEFEEPQRAITPGQAVVLYDGEMVVGGGTIREIL